MNWAAKTTLTQYGARIMNGVPHAPIGDACAATRNRARSGLALARLPHPGRNVPRRMQDAPDIDFRLPLYVEDQIRKLSGRLEAKAGNIQLMGIAGASPSPAVR